MVPGATGTRFFEKTRGLPQGSPESPLLFHLFLDRLPRVLHSKCYGIQLANVSCSSLLSADDIAIVAESAAELRIALKLADEFFTI